MKEQKDYLSDIEAIRSMMERSSKFLSLSGWAGILSGLYAITGCFFLSEYFEFQPEAYNYSATDFRATPSLIITLLVLIMAITTAFTDSYLKARKKGVNAWNKTSRNMLSAMLIPLVTGALLSCIMIYHDMIGLVIPFTLIFYGISLYIAGYYTYRVIRILGILQIVAGLSSALFIENSLLIWAAGFGVLHILYGIYMFKFER